MVAESNESFEMVAKTDKIQDDSRRSIPPPCINSWVDFCETLILTQLHFNKNSSGDEIANVNFFYNIAHAEASAYAH